MARGAHEIPGKNKLPVRGLILLLLLLALAVGGVTAFLSTSDGPLTNNFPIEDHPSLGVNPSENDNPQYNNDIVINTISGGSSGYAVYLRAKVLVNWVNANGDILAEMPVAGQGRDYELTVSNQWREINGIYYYTSVIQKNGTIEPPVTITNAVNKTGYQLKVTVLAQTVQAVGETDDGSKTAVEDAWGVSATDFIQPTQQS